MCQIFKTSFSRLNPVPRGQATVIRSFIRGDRGHQQRTIQSDKLPTYLLSFPRFRPARPSQGSSGQGSDMRSNLTPGSLQINLLFTMYAEQAQGVSPGANFYFFKDKVSVSHQHQNLGGAERDRTADPLLAKQVLSQLSYSPIQVAPQGFNQEIRQRLNHKSIQTFQVRSLRSKAQRQIMVGPGRLELPTPRLSSVCSNRLSYGPIRMEQHEDHPVQNTRRPKRGPCLLKKEKRGRRSAPYRPDP